MLGTLAVVVVVAMVAAGNSRADRSSNAGSGSAGQARVTVTATQTVTVTATPSSGPAASTVATTPAGVAATGGPYLAGALDVQFPAGNPGEISVAAEGPHNSGGYGTSWPIVVRNNTGGPVCDIAGTVTATSGGKLVGSHDLQALAPAVVADGGVAFGSAYFDTQIPADAVVEYTFTNGKAGNCWNKPAVIDEVNVVPSGPVGTNLVGKIHAEDKKIGGPIGIDVLCMDGNGQPLAGGTSVEFADQEELAPGQSGTFSVSTPGDGPCDQYLLAASGYGF